MKKSKIVYYDSYLIYRNFIEECKNKKYDDDLVLHQHHIIPKHISVDDNFIQSKENIITISVTDHIQAHLLLSDMFEENTYEQISNLRSARLLNKKSIQDKKTLNRISNTYKGQNNPFYGKTHSQEVINKLSNVMKNKYGGVMYEERYGESAAEEKLKRSKGVKSFYENASDEWKKKRAENITKSLKGKNKGGDNGFAKKIKLEGIVYDSITDATRELGISKYKLKKYYKYKEL